jgi:hypothetical protein
MAEIIITPEGKDALEVGTFVDDAGQRFIALNFRQPGGDDVVVTFNVPLFREYAAHLSNVAKLA